MAEEKKKVEEIELTEVTTQTATMIKLPDGKVISQMDYMVWLGNEILKIRKAVA